MQTAEEKRAYNKERQRKRRATYTPAQHEAEKAANARRMKAHYEENTEEFLARKKERYHANPEPHRATCKRHYENNKEAKEAQRQERLRNMTPEQRAEYDRRKREESAARALEWHGRVGKLINSARGRAKNKGLDMTITIPYLLELVKENDYCCAWTGGKFDLLPPEGTTKNPWAPSLDRIDPFQGYVPGNVRVIYSMLNGMKGQHSDEEVMYLATLLMISHDS